MKQLKVLMLEPNKAPYTMMIDDTLEAKQTAVGGRIEMTTPPSHPDDAVVICNEEGKLDGLPLNRALRLDDGLVYDIVAGSFFICRAPWDSDGFESLTDEQIGFYSKMYA